MYIEETYISKENIYDEKGAIFGQSDPYEPFTDDIGRLFRELQQEFGRCQSRMWVEFKDKSKKERPAGWVFVKRKKYSDSRNGETYLQETWVTLLEKEKCTECGRPVYRYHFLDQEVETSA